VQSAGPIPFDALPIGARVRVFPNHVCMTAAMYDRYHVVAGSDAVVDEWPRHNGW
jgi:D-serine deaminase-like pyridoxal phosphate-dependent protein